MSLLGEEVEAPSDQLNEPLAAEVNWFWDEGKPGEGDRPDFLSEKFKSVADMAKSQKELEKKLGNAPDKYDFSKAQEWIEEDYEPFIEMAEFAKQNHVSQDVMDKMLGSVGLYLKEFSSDLEEEKGKLGEDAGERIRVLNNWAKSNLTEKSFGVLSNSMRTAESIEALEEIRSKMMGSETIIPSQNDSSTAAGYTLEEYRSELNENYDKYKNDPAYRKQLAVKLERLKLKPKS